MTQPVRPQTTNNMTYALCNPDK